jgi:hypothetical protein
MSRNTRFFDTWSRNGDTSKNGVTEDSVIDGEYATRKAVIIRRTIQSVFEYTEQDEKREFTEPDLIMDILSSYPMRFQEIRRIFSRAMELPMNLRF